MLTVYKRVHDYRDFRSGIVVTLYHDGMVYMLCILSACRMLALEIPSSNTIRAAITVANVIIGAAFAVRVWSVRSYHSLTFSSFLQSAYSNMFDTYVTGCTLAASWSWTHCIRLQLVIHSVLASRILFRLRSSNQRVHEPTMSATVLDTIDYLHAGPSSMPTSGTGTTRSEVWGLEGMCMYAEPSVSVTIRSLCSYLKYKNL
jgi:hypothetical protein